MAHPIKHFRTVFRHRRRVIVHCAKAGILWRGLMHDLSKYSPTEFLPGARYFVGERSPNEIERREHGFSAAWIHHKGRNRHHFEYWTDYDPVTHVMTPVKMPLRFVAEMFCDRVAASKVYQGKQYSDAHPLAYFEKGKPTRAIHPATSDLLESWLVMLKEQGEAATFRHIRGMLKAKQEY